MFVCSDHFGPLLGFISDELPEIRRRAHKRGSSQVDKPCLEIGVG
jgi:hypothetical protein